MPEGPEAKRIADQLNERCVGWRFSVNEFDGRYKNVPPKGFDEFSSEEHIVKSVKAKGKFVYWTFEDDWSLWNTLGMSGTWAFPNLLVSSTFPPKHTAMNVSLVKGARAFISVGDSMTSTLVAFVDSRHFGTLKFVKGKEALDEKLHSMMFDFLEGPKSTTAIWWYLRDCKKRLLDKEVSVALMDQSVFPGIGNYLRAEILYAAKVSPWRYLRDVTYDEFDRICAAAHSIMWNSYESGGATIATYRDAKGEEGKYTSRFAVYSRTTDPFGNAVKRERTPDGRTIHWCPAAQI